ncbi:MAG: hypothetical protein ABSH53_13235 [Holophaga sp.]|jgi:hypothetical protein
MNTNSLWGCVFILLTGCAGVQVVPLNPDGTQAQKAAPGIRYYLPQPYLLVAELPPVEAQAGGKDLKSPSSSSGKPGDAGSAQGGDTTSASAAPSASTDTGFFAATPQYVMKLIYLPDYDHPMAITAKAGMGTVQWNPTLQDGWMLTSLTANSDSKVAEMLTALGTTATGVKGGTTTKAAPSEEPGPKAAPSGADKLDPGLYRFEFDSATHHFRLKAVTWFKEGKLLQVP